VDFGKEMVNQVLISEDNAFAKEEVGGPVLRSRRGSRINQKGLETEGIVNWIVVAADGKEVANQFSTTLGSR